MKLAESRPHIGYCTHEECRMHTIQELLFMVNVLGRRDLIEAAIVASRPETEIRCRCVSVGRYARRS